MHVQPFQQLTPTAAVGEPIPPGWQPLQTCPLCILVGVTGVGKSTLLQEILARAPHLQLLPDRRTLTDDLIIAHMQHEDGEPAHPVRDRTLRFAYTRRYRERFPGGMAHALSHLRVAGSPEGSRRDEPGTASPAISWIFDGLRGVNEVTHAVALLPQARFAVLDAPDWVRVQRLLGRQDVFDQIASSTGSAVGSAAGSAARSPAPDSLEELGLADAAAILPPDAIARLLEGVAAGAFSVDDLRAKLQIVVEERRNYDPAATRNVLATQLPGRTLILDTVTQTPQSLAETLLAWLGLPAQRNPDHATQ